MPTQETLSSLAQKDVRSQLHPYTNARAHLQSGPLVIERGEGVFVIDEKGKRYLEGMAGLWSVALGFSNERLIRAAEEQLRKLPFYHQFGHKAHAPSIELAELLLDLAPVPMSKVFFTNSGSEANDTVVKLVWYYNNALGRPLKKKFIARQSAYHGITLASASLTGLPANQRGFDLPLPGFLHVGCPNHYRGALPGETEEQFADRLAAELDATIRREGPETVAAFIGEPLMGAGGVIVPPRTYWEKIQQVCRRHDVLVVADEVVCGFGRTGRMFGSQTFAIEPDIMVMSKQLSSSYQPISALLINEELFQSIADQSSNIGTLGHGFTGAGHPVAAAVALENIKVILEENLVEHAADMGKRLHAGLQRFADHPMVGEIRGVGLIAGVELVGDRETKAPFGAVGDLGRYLAARTHEHGLILRNVGDVIAFCPPLVTAEAEVDQLLERFGRAFEDTAAWLARQR
ncbi:aspartate aminotransferase family protein [Pseudomonas citronellolis]|uniref:Aspartate aminotransferase family protein n=1 Tax=Pseudomonas citronellolis TaxID=53408 RepID=A0AAW6PAE7_9PSED|nr:aspartate aminotransferase family protein [Pseudomonas citronellolis]MDF3844127.1 aspartate aminotransferase family protein [Pseudomonas citronellolis]